MLLFANGCSHTQGAETTASNKPEKNIQFAYPKYVAEHFERDYINISTSGCSNEWIVSSTINWLMENEDKTENIFVVVGWTTYPRKTICNEEGMFFWTPAIQNPEWCVSSGKNITGMDDYFKAWVTHDTYHEAAGDTFFHNVMYLHTWLKSKGYNHVFVNTWWPWKVENENQTKEIENIKNYWKPLSEESTLCYQEKKNECQVMPGIHMDARAHKMYSLDLIEYIEENNLHKLRIS